MVEIVAPLGVDAVTADFPWPYDSRVVEIALGDERQVTPRLCLKFGHLRSQLFKKMYRRGIDDGVHGVDAQSVEVIVLEPHERIVAKESTYFVTTNSIEINRLAPRSRVALGEIGTKPGEVVAGRPHVVVDNVQHHRQAPSVARIHQALEIIRLTVSMMRRVEIDAIVAPTAISRELGHGHNLYWRKPRFEKIVE